MECHLGEAAVENKNIPILGRVATDGVAMFHYSQLLSVIA